MKNSIRLMVAVLAAALVVAGSGCARFQKKSVYEASRESRPLEVPPDLDSPSTAGNMAIPATGANAEAAAAEGVPRMGSTRTAQTIYAGDESSLSVKDGAAGAWRRVGLALERSGVAEIVSRDESAGTYTLKGDATPAQPAEKPGFFRRVFGRDTPEGGTQGDDGTRVVRVRAEGEGSTILVEDAAGNAVDDDLARRLIAAIKQRLG